MTDFITPVGGGCFYEPTRDRVGSQSF